MQELTVLSFHLMLEADKYRICAGCLEILHREERAGFRGLLVQERIPAERRTLRVTVMGMRLFAYWRVQDDPGALTHNLTTGGRLDPESEPWLQRKGISLVRKLLALARIDLAGMDVLFTPQEEPLLMEINYTFGRRGLWGSEAFFRHLQAAVHDWMRKRGLCFAKGFGT